jgi:hypothetical protein
MTFQPAQIDYARQALEYIGTQNTGFTEEEALAVIGNHNIFQEIPNEFIRQMFQYLKASNIIRSPYFQTNQGTRYTISSTTFHHDTGINAMFKTRYLDYEILLLWRYVSWFNTQQNIALLNQMFQQAYPQIEKALQYATIGGLTPSAKQLLQTIVQTGTNFLQSHFTPEQIILIKSLL